MEGSEDDRRSDTPHADIDESNTIPKSAENSDIDSNIDSDTGEPFLLEDPEDQNYAEDELDAYWETEAADASKY